MAKQDEQRLMVKIATLYYLEGMKQSDIAQLLKLSQSFVSRILNRSVKEGVVKISVVPPANVFPELEKAIEQAYQLPQAIVVDVPEQASALQIKQSIGSAAAHYLETRLRADELIGISSWSGTIRAMVDALHPLTAPCRGVIQLLGGVGTNGNVQATILTQNLAALLNCPAWLLPSQSIEHSVHDRQRLSVNPDVAVVLEKFEQVDLAIVGIGDLEPSALLRNSGNYYDEEMLRTLAQRGAVGDICLHYFDAEGKPVLSAAEDPVIGMELAQVKKCPQVVALAGGKEKAQAIRGALRGGYVNVLIVDYPTARLLLEG
ncbi:sugar-binding transcriptional regulator [Erwiniaceae bacterium L1_54_6]|jgi:DNA-binding transcriptional regulator LsrR (DeoR family)|uniref:DNA-binding transcriptional regulator n=1 Tax=Pantoea cypripedii TaxID=55209 RepID=A0A6B9G7U7_PANCY|nr:sugar-binding transcriptional regulator [Pantoea cypripedii]MDF7657811.1 sugar-binding transcriptional regulator [Erwiniaceae bacterium L1_54_6]QGY28839.1 DNA-binding transcriptional regulator [Pantoea cypripedii]